MARQAKQLIVYLLKVGLQKLSTIKIKFKHYALELERKRSNFILCCSLIAISIFILQWIRTRAVMRSHTDNSATIPQQSRLKKAHQKKANISFESSFLHFSSSMQQEETFLTFLLFMVFQTNRMINSSCAVTLQFVWKKITKRKFLHFWDY